MGRITSSLLYSDSLTDRLWGATRLGAPALLGLYLGFQAMFFGITLYHHQKPSVEDCRISSKVWDDLDAFVKAMVVGLFAAEQYNCPEVDPSLVTN